MTCLRHTVGTLCLGMSCFSSSSLSLAMHFTVTTKYWLNLKGPQLCLGAGDSAPQVQDSDSTGRPSPAASSAWDLVYLVPWSPCPWSWGLQCIWARWGGRSKTVGQEEWNHGVGGCMTTHLHLAGALK